MSTPTPPGIEDSALARRYSFLGFPSERRGGALSYSEMQAELGPANAASLITQIGVLVQAHHADQQGLGLNHIVDRIVQAMTPDERRTMSQSNMVPSRVQALISAEVEAARQQSAQLGKGAAGANAAAGPSAGGGWQLVNGQWVQAGARGNSSMEGGDHSSATTRDAGGSTSSGGTYSGNIGGVNQRNYTGTPFASTGMSYSTFSSLRSQGFGETNIMHAAQDSRTNGFNVNDKKIGSAFAVLDKDDGKRREERNHLLANFRERLDSDETFQNLKVERDKTVEGSAERTAAEQRLYERGQQISKEGGYQGHVQAAPTQRARDAGKLIEHETIKQKFEGHVNNLEHGDKAKVAADIDIVDRYRRNPQDAATRHAYDELNQRLSKVPSSKLALADIRAVQRSL
jgi:hypothetical protein